MRTSYDLCKGEWYIWIIILKKQDTILLHPVDVVICWFCMDPFSNFGCLIQIYALWDEDSSTHWHQQKQLGLCVLWSQQRVEYIWTPHIMAHSTIMWCGNGRETTCHCGWERDSRTEARPRARPVLQFTFNRSLSPFYSVYVIALFFFLISSTLCLSSPFKYLMFPSCALSVSFKFFQTSVLWPEGYCLWKNVLHGPRQYRGYSLKESISCHSITSSHG